MRTGRLMALALLLAAAIPVTGAGGQEQPPAQSWVGWVERHGEHHDYEGSPCPEQSEFCTANIVRYRLVPANPAVAGQLAAQEGRRTRLHGSLERMEDPEHQGVLTVERAEPVEPHGNLDVPDKVLKSVTHLTDNVRDGAAD